MLLRPQGATVEELVFEGVLKLNKNGSYSAVFDYLGYMYGYDVRAFRRKGVWRKDCSKVYKIVGRKRWCGKYESYINPKDYAVEIEFLRRQEVV